MVMDFFKWHIRSIYAVVPECTCIAVFVYFTYRSDMPVARCTKSMVISLCILYVRLLAPCFLCLSALCCAWNRFEKMNKGKDGVLHTCIECECGFDLLLLRRFRPFSFLSSDLYICVARQIANLQVKYVEWAWMCVLLRNINFISIHYVYQSWFIAMILCIVWTGRSYALACACSLLKRHY